MRFFLILAALYLSALHSEAQAHEGRPLFVQIFETKPGIANLQVSMPPSIPVDNRPSVTLSGRCAKIETPIKPEVLQPNERFRCMEAGLKGAVIEVHYPRGNPAITTLVLTKLADGREIVTTMAPDTPRHIFPVSQSFVHVAFDYIKLGVTHILGGIDHLLFVFGLFLLARSARQLLIVLTGFTVAHSITLAASTLGWVNVPVPPTEAVIALSIIFVARELMRDKTSFAQRFPVVVAFGFGLLHGFGFASVLRETGLPDDNIVSALLFFNVGVEIGQIIFVIALALLARAWKMALAKAGDNTLGKLRNPHWQARIAAYGLGGVSTMWFLQRIGGMFA